MGKGNNNKQNNESAGKPTDAELAFNKRMAEMDEKLATIDKKTAELDEAKAEMDEKLAELDAENDPIESPDGQSLDGSVDKQRDKQL